MNLGEVQQRQAEYDEQFWAHPSGFETVRHVSHHLGKLIGKVAEYCENTEDGKLADNSQLVNEVIPDLLIYAARLANDPTNDSGMTLEELFDKRTRELIEKFSSKPAEAVSGSVHGNTEFISAVELEEEDLRKEMGAGHTA